MALFNKLFFPTATAETSSSSSPSSSSSSSTTPISISASVKSVSNSRTSSSLTNNNKRHSSSQTVHSKNYLSQFPFDGEQVRVLLYRECDSQGRRLLFDSNALQKVMLKETNGNATKTEKITRSDEKISTSSSSYVNRNCSTNNGEDGDERQQKRKYQQNNSKKNNAVGFIEVNEEYGYKHTRPKSTDITGIGEMVFGASAMSFRGTAFKVHWLKAPARILCSQVFLSPVSSANGQSPQSTISLNSFMTPRHSFSSEYGGSVDGVSLNSFSMPITVGSVGCNAGLTPSACSSLITTSVDVPDHISVSNNSHSSDSIRDINAPRYSSTYSTATDSGYSGISRIVGSNLCSDQWSSSYQFSTRSSLISESSEQYESIRKLSTDSSCGPISTSLMDQFSSDGSLQRRITRNINTSFENKNSMNDIIGFVSDNYPSGASNGGGGSEGSVAIGRRVNNCTNIESNSNPEIGRRRDGTLKSTNRRAKLGLAVCILLSESFEEEMEVFCSEHMALLESMLSRLRAYTERAYIYHKDFLQIMCHAWEMTQKWINDLFSAPRIKCPIWLSITTSGSKYSKNVAERFIKELCWLLSLADTKDTNFFVSTMLTAVLTYHLGWVSTVSASSHSHDSTRSESASASAIEQRAKLLEVSQKHPYNALWAQMGDLYGAVGMPPKLTRTVIYGTEKLSVERLLNILTYFIRCGEVRRSSKREDFNKELLTTALQQNKKESFKKSNKCQLKKECVNSSVNSLLKSTIKRTQTCNQNLNTITDNCETDTDTDTDSEEGNEEEEEEEGDDDEQLQNQNIIGTMKKNEIPNVFAFRDSRFVQQELRIGNYLMDTGILKSSLLKSQSKSLNSGDMHGGKQKIRLTVTSPENEKTRLLEVGFNESLKKTLEAGAVEAIEIGSDVVACTTPHSEQEPNYTNNLFHNITAASEKEGGLNLRDPEKSKRQLTQRHSSFTSQEESGSNDTLVETKKPLENLMSQLSLSDLITQNSMGKGERMTWGIEPIKEAISSEERIHFDVCHQTNKERQNKENFRENASDVVFVLGDNEPLVNIKRSTEDLSQTEDRGLNINKTKYSSQHQSLCPLHQRTHSQLSTMLTKKHHSGVKFNFKTYPQIATNYMKNKNLVISNTEDTFIIEKSKQNDANVVIDVFPPASEMPHASTSNDVACLATTCVTCVVCSSILNSYQTPSNATELDSETDKEHGYPVTGNRTVQNSCVLQTVNSATSVDTLKSLSNANIEDAAVACQSRLVQQEFVPMSKRRNTYTGNSRKQHSQRGSTSSVAIKCAALSEAIKLLKLPVPGIKELPQDDESYGGDMKLRAGFIPSLFLNVSDHYISDMVLQGTFASPKQWEINLREDLALAAHSASLISLPVENVAIVADMEKWDVRLISSQTQCFPYAGGQSAPVGMSLLVSSMLETVQAMNSSGIGAYECLAFLESKLKEIYLQSETLAVFLLATDFCPLAAVTSALNLSENDVPLLLSVASIHTPQISKKCGISFR